MHSDQSSILRRTLPQATFAKLRELLQQLANRVKQATPPASLSMDTAQGRNFSLFLTENVISSLEIPQGILPEKFVLVVSQQFSALVLADRVRSNSDWELDNGRNAHFLEMGLTFDGDAIANFLAKLSHLLKYNPVAWKTLQTATQILQPNDPVLQSEFTISLLAILSENGKQNDQREIIYPSVWVCQPVQQALQQQVEQERLLNHVTTQIRQTLELPVILKTAVEEVRDFLQADRLIIYQFKESKIEKTSPVASLPDLSESSTSFIYDYPFLELNPQGETCPVGGCWGQITYEARASENISSVLNLTEERFCFVGVKDCQNKYRKGFTLAVEDVETTYLFSPCLLQLLRKNQVRSKLVIPIVVQEELWGLLIAHQCFEPRQWQESEKNFLRYIAEHLAIAIYQAQLYAELQQQKQTLEQRVIERTQELHDILLAAQSANRTKTEFLATMSHELRTPLTCVIGLSATLLRWSFGQLSPKQREYLQTIHDNGEHLLELINDILELSQLEAGKTILNITDFSLSALAHQSLLVVRDRAIQKGVELLLNLRIQPTQDRFLADAKRVSQILFNLLSNGIKFTPEGGKVILRVWLEGNSAVFQVEDSGIGIPEHQISLLFQKFQQLDTSYQRQYEGTGLGLALTKQLVELHRGRIEVESAVDVGSIFTVWLPLPPSSTIIPSPIKPQNTDLPQGRIVLIENDEEIATLICDILTATGYQMVWIIEASTAIKQIEIVQPLAVIVEMNLAGINGYEVIRQLRNSPTMSNIKILALSDQEFADHDLADMAIKPNDYLLKPIQPQELLQKIQAIITDW